MAGGELGLMALLAAAGFLLPEESAAQQVGAGVTGAFATRGVAATLKALGATGSVESRDIRIEAPDVSEAGSQVPIVITSSIPRTESIAILIEDNPNALSSVFEVPAVQIPTSR